MVFILLFSVTYFGILDNFSDFDDSRFYDAKRNAVHAYSSQFFRDEDAQFPHLALLQAILQRLAANYSP